MQKKYGGGRFEFQCCAFDAAVCIVFLYITSQYGHHISNHGKNLIFRQLFSQCMQSWLSTAYLTLLDTSRAMVLYILHLMHTKVRAVPYVSCTHNECVLLQMGCFDLLLSNFC